MVGTYWTKIMWCIVQWFLGSDLAPLLWDCGLTLPPGTGHLYWLDSHNLGKKYLKRKRVEVRVHRHSSPTDQMMWELGKHWDIPAQCKFNDVIRRSGDLIFFFKVKYYLWLHVSYHHKYTYMYWLYIQKIKVSWIMTDEAKKVLKNLHKLITWCTNYVINSCTSEMPSWIFWSDQVVC